MKKVKGKWWLPDSQENKVPGELIIEDNGNIFLNLLGSLKDIDINNPSFNPGIILGNTIENNDVTLVRNLIYHWNSGLFSENPIMDFRTSFVLIGNHFISQEDIKFDTVSFTTSNLDEWFDLRISELLNPHDTNNITVNYKVLPPKIIELPPYDVVLETIYHQNVTFKRAEVSDKTRITLKQSKKYSLLEWLNHIQEIINFIDLGTGYSSFITELFASDSDLLEALPGKVRKTIEIFYETSTWRHNVRRPDRFEMVYTYSKIVDNIETYLHNWIDKSELLTPIVNIFFSIRNNSNVYLESQLLGVTQALETYHRRARGGYYINSEEFKNGLLKILTDAIPTTIDNSFKQSIIDGRLKYANEYSMRKRYRILLDELYEKYLSIIYPRKDELLMFIDKVCDTRNYLTHYETELVGKKMNTTEMFKAVQILLYIIEILLLQEIGLGDKIILERLTQTNRIPQNL